MSVIVYWHIHTVFVTKTENMETAPGNVAFLNSFNKLCCKCAFIHSIGMCRMRRFLAVLKSFFHSSLLYTLSFHLFPPASLPSSITSSCHLYLVLRLSLVVSKFRCNTLLGILLSSILCPCPNQRNLFNFLVLFFFFNILLTVHLNIFIN